MVFSSRFRSPFGINFSSENDTNNPITSICMKLTDTDRKGNIDDVDIEGIVRVL